MSDWHVEVRWADGPFPVRKKVYKASVALVFSKKNHPQAAAVWLIDENDKCAIEMQAVKGYLTSKDKKYIVPISLDTQKALLMYLTGEVSRDQLVAQIQERWNRPEPEIIKPENCSGCSMCKPKSKNRYGQVDKKVTRPEKNR